MIEHRRLIAMMALQLVVASGCGGEATNGGGSETGFLACAEDAMCPAGGSCVEGHCVAPSSQELKSDRRSSPINGSAVDACEAADEFPPGEDAWWEGEWASSLASLGLPKCGADATLFDSPAPAIAVKWRAPHDGEYFVRGWTRDFNGLLSGSATCGRQTDAGCAMLPPASLPAAPWDQTAFPGGGFNLYAHAGEVFYLWFQYDAASGGTPPDHGAVIANVSTLSFGGDTF